MWKTVVCLLAFAALVPSLSAQKLYTAVRRMDVQAGVAGSSYTLDYGEGREEGITVFGDVDFAHHLGLEVLYRNASIQTPHDIGENHLLGGPRFRFQKGRFFPYVKVLAGSGTINFQQGYNVSAYSQTYFIVSFGGGVDYEAPRHINVRLFDFEYQEWPTFKPNGLTPTGFSVGVAYHF